MGTIRHQQRPFYWRFLRRHAHRCGLVSQTMIGPGPIPWANSTWMPRLLLNYFNSTYYCHLVVTFLLTECCSFGMHYQPYLMFLQTCPSLSDLLTRSPLLFWTIIQVASQDHPRFASIYQKVVAEHEGLLSPILQRAIQQMETIHALLLLCLWPIPQSQHFHNPAWNYVGLAIHAAMQLNCHSPLGPDSETSGWKGLGHVGMSELSIADQARTWLGCFWIGTV
jgi:hypothetical protein